MLVSFVFTPEAAQAYETNQRSKVIHVVYDDSGSMIRVGGLAGTGPFLDRWGQAKYAMEVFAAMLEERDKMHVYYMSDFVTSIGGRTDASAGVEISGLEPAAERVMKIREKVTRASGTPFDSVVKAYSDLRTTAADEKWLVILTDGEFNLLDGLPNNNININGILSQYARERIANIMILAIGDDEDLKRMLNTLTGDLNNGYFVEHAESSKDILGKITSICNQIFNRNNLRYSDALRYEFAFDIPMRELLVFAQGEGVRINGIRGSGSFSPNETVNVRYSDVAAIGLENNDDVVKSHELTGVIASFQNIPKGYYGLDVTDADTVEIYYKPDVKLGIKLFKGRREIHTQDIEEGNYQIRFGIVNERGDFFESELLGTVNYTATVRNSGSITENISNGQTITLRPGEFIIDVKAQFLDINTAESMHARHVLAAPTFLERLMKLWPLWLLLLCLLLYYFLWGRKKRFPRYMSKKPTINVETESGTLIKYGKFKIEAFTIWMPGYSEKGIIEASTDRKLPRLKVKAVGNDCMELTNTSDFSPDRLGSSIEFFINDQPLPEKSTKKRIMSCTARIKSVYYNMGVATTHICSFTKRNKKRKKK